MASPIPTLLTCLTTNQDLIVVNILQVDLALDVEDLMFARIRKYYRMTTEKVYPNDDDSLLHKFRGFLFPADKEEGKKKSKIGDLRPPLVSLYAYICDRICEKGFYTRIQFCNFEEA